MTVGTASTSDGKDPTKGDQLFDSKNKLNISQKKMIKVKQQNHQQLCLYLMLMLQAILNIMEKQPCTIVVQGYSQQ